MAAEPALFAPGPHGPTLYAVRCGQCEYLDFPPQTYGCRRCGAHGENLIATSIPAAGAVRTSAVVHQHAEHSVPFIIAAVRLDAGPTTRVLMRDTTPLNIGDRVHGELVDTGGGVLDLLFSTEPAS